MNNSTNLTRQELSVLMYAAKGYGVKETAEIMFLEPNTVKTHRQRVLERIGARNMTQAVAMVYQWLWMETINNAKR